MRGKPAVHLARASRRPPVRCRAARSPGGIGSGSAGGLRPRFRSYSAPCRNGSGSEPASAQSRPNSSSIASKGSARTVSESLHTPTIVHVPSRSRSTSSSTLQGVHEPGVRHARLGVDAQLPAAVDTPGGGGEHLANPVRSKGEEGLLRHGGQPLPSPPGEVGHDHVLSKVKLRLVEDPPAPRAAGAVVEGTKQPCRAETPSPMPRRGPRAQEELAVQDLRHLVLGSVQDVLVRRALHARRLPSFGRVQSMPPPETAARRRSPAMTPPPAGRILARGEDRAGPFQASQHPGGSTTKVCGGRRDHGPGPSREGLRLERRRSAPEDQHVRLEIDSVGPDDGAQLDAHADGAEERRSHRTGSNTAPLKHGPRSTSRAEPSVRASRTRKPPSASTPRILTMLAP